MHLSAKKWCIKARGFFTQKIIQITFRYLIQFQTKNKTNSK